VRTTAGKPVRCLSSAIAAGRGAGPKVMAGPTGRRPSQTQSAYKPSGLSSGGRTVAIVDAYDDPKAESDLATFRKTYGLSACTTANRSFKKVNGSGATSPVPSTDHGRADKAVDTAAKTSGVAAVSNSYDGSESSSQRGDDAHFNHSRGRDHRKLR
jgi:hypothetical protein